MSSLNKCTSDKSTPAIDPVCGMTVDPQKAAGSFEYKDQTYFFCSLGCREKFKADPERFLNSQPVAPIGIQRREDVAIAPGTNTERIGRGEEEGGQGWPRSEYTCPMHPEIVRDGPGTCPICGMALEPRTITLEEGPNPELIDMTRRLRVAASLALPVVLLAMGDMVISPGLGRRIDARAANWLGFVLATPI